MCEVQKCMQNFFRALMFQLGDKNDILPVAM